MESGGSPPLPRCSDLSTDLLLYDNSLIRHSFFSHISIPIHTYTNTRHKEETHTMPHKIILDTDPGVDDVLAILLALSSPEVDLALISIVFGNTHAPVAHSNLLKIYHLLAQEVAQTAGAEGRYGRLKGQVKTVLAMGEDGPIGGEKAVAAYFVGFSVTVPLCCRCEKTLAD